MIQIKRKSSGPVSETLDVEGGSGKVGVKKMKTSPFLNEQGWPLPKIKRNPDEKLRHIYPLYEFDQDCLGLGNSYSQQIFRVRGFVKNTMKNRNDFKLDFEVFDTSGCIPALFFGYVPDRASEAIMEQIVHDGIAALTFTYKEDAKYGKQLIVDLIQPVDMTTINKEDYYPWQAQGFNPNKAYNDLLNHVRNKFTDPELKALLTEVLTMESVYPAILSCPAAQKLHQNFPGGLLMHIRGMMCQAKRLHEVYPSIDLHLLQAGIILHDLGKLDDYVLNPVWGDVEEYSDEGEMLTHAVTGQRYLNEAAARVNMREPDTVSKQTVTLLGHMIASHHGNKEWGAMMEPMFREAQLLHLIDHIDALAWEYNDIYQTMQPGVKSEKKFPFNKVRKPHKRFTWTD